MPIATANNQQIYYETRGNPANPPLLIISGITDYTAKAEWQAADLSSQFFVILFDNRGAGRSLAAKSGYTIADMADDTVGLVEGLGIDSAYVFGFSMGGMIALELVLRYPHRVRRLALGCTTAGGRLFVQPDEWALRELSLPVRSGDRRRDYLNGLWLSVSDRYVAEQPEVVDRLADIAAANPQTPLGYAGQFQAVLTHDVADRLGEIAVPTLILHGGADKMIPVENGRILAANIPGARLVIYPEAGHLFFIEEARAVNEEILRFFGRSEIFDSDKGKQ